MSLRAMGVPLWDHGGGQREIDRLSGRPLPFDVETASEAQGDMTAAELRTLIDRLGRRFKLLTSRLWLEGVAQMTDYAAPCSRCHHQFRHHAVTEDGYRCRGCKCKRRFWR